MNIERLKTLARFLNTRVSDKEFDIRYWISKSDCGTTCCALGWACCIPDFQESGLTLYKVRNYDTPIPCYNVGEEKHESFKAAEEFFGLTNKECFYIFDSAQYKNDENVSPKTVSRRIYKLIKDNGIVNVS